ncbi:MAG: hypothetical protein WC763_04390 [Candidatus Paceibacterota bacterium]|jgi:hypothetical protein
MSTRNASAAPHRASVIDDSGTSKQPIRFPLSGDVFQLATQEKALLNAGLSVGRADIYPGLYDVEDFKRALTIIWKQKLEGWWHYRAEFIRHSICDELAFAQAR